jgi:cell division protein FtsW
VEGVVSRIGTAPAIAVLIAVLCVFGLIMVGSASPLISMQLYGSPWSILIRQSLWMGVGTGALLVTYKMDYRKWRRVRGPLVVVTMGLLVAVLVPHLGVSAGGSSRWIGVGMLQLQPSELMKLALAIFAADLLTRRSHLMADPKLVVVPVLAVLGISGVLILKQPDMGTALVLSCIAFGVLFIGGVPMTPILKIVGVFGGLAVVVGLADPYRRDRILSFLNPGATRSGTGYQVWQSLIGLGSGHLFGLGLGGGREKWGTLPNAHTDFIFSVVGEELGLVGAVALLALFFALAWFGLRAATRAPDRFGSLLAVGITTWITSQAVINIGAVIGVLPVTGIPLPFISFGGSSLVISMAAAGILVNIASHERSTTVSNGLRLRPLRR